MHQDVYCFIGFAFLPDPDTDPSKGNNNTVLPSQIIISKGVVIWIHIKMKDRISGSPSKCSGFATLIKLLELKLTQRDINKLLPCEKELKA
jgi:hypothetical protein